MDGMHGRRDGRDDGGRHEGYDESQGDKIEGVRVRMDRGGGSGPR